MRLLRTVRYDRVPFGKLLRGGEGRCGYCSALSHFACKVQPQDVSMEVSQEFSPSHLRKTKF